MDAVNEEVVQFEQFLQFPKFQRVSRFLHFQFERNEFGRLFNKTEKMFFVSLISDFFFFGLNIFDIIRSLQLGETSHVNLPVLSIAVYFTIRGFMIYVNRHDIVDFLNALDAEFPHDLATQRKFDMTKLFRQYLIRCRYVDFYAFLTLVGFCLTPLVTYALTYENNKAPILLNHQLLGGWLPYDLRQNHTIYPLVWIYDVVSMLVGVAFFASFDALFHTMQTQIIMHLDFLSRQLERINGADSLNLDYESQFYEYICALIRRQQQLNMICDKFNNIFKLAIFLSDLVGATSICFHLYLIAETRDPLMIVKYTLSCGVVVIFTFEGCLKGTQLEEASSRLNEALYNQNWYVGSAKYRKLMLIWLKYSQLTKKLTAYGLVEINMMHFTEIMQLAYKLFTFLRSRQ